MNGFDAGVASSRSRAPPPPRRRREDKLLVPPRSLARRDDDDDDARLARWMHPRVAHSGRVESSAHARGAIGDRPTHSIDPIDEIDEIDRSNDRWTDRSPIDRSWIHSWVTNGHRGGSEHPLGRWWMRGHLDRSTRGGWGSSWVMIGRWGSKNISGTAYLFCVLAGRLDGVGVGRDRSRSVGRDRSVGRSVGRRSRRGGTMR
jgi:hypothetical protein